MEKEIIGLIPLGLIPKESLWKEMAPYLPIKINEKIKNNKIQINYEVKE